LINHHRVALIARKRPSWSIWFGWLLASGVSHVGLSTKST
jgi:hypothetical protein